MSPALQPIPLLPLNQADAVGTPVPLGGKYALGMDVDRVLDLMAWGREHVSLDTPVDEDQIRDPQAAKSGSPRRRGRWSASRSS